MRKFSLLSEPGPVGACYHRSVRIEISDKGRQHPQMVTMKKIGLEAFDRLSDHDFEGVAVSLELTLGEVRPDRRAIGHHVAHSDNRKRKVLCFEPDGEEFGKVRLVVRPQPHHRGRLVP